MRQMLPQGPDKALAVRTMFDRIARRYDLVNRVMTFGMDVGWRRRSVRSLRLPPGSLVLDLGCGTGDLCRELQRSGYRAIGVDFSRGMLMAARTTAPLLQADILRMPTRDACADGATSGFALRNVADLAALFDEMARIVRPGGRVAVLEVSEPTSPALRAGHRAYFRKIVPLIGGVLSDREAYGYLPRSTAYLPPQRELIRMLESCGFERAASRPLSGGIVRLLTATRSEV